MAELTAHSLDSTRLLFDLQRANEIVQCFSGCLDADLIARRATDGLVDRFNCAFARIWLIEPDFTSLRLVASSGLYTRTDGSFARVPMGAYKVGKIAQNRVSFLSNNLAEESWVKDREWAIANHIRGFAGFPLVVSDAQNTSQPERVIGVLAVFSHTALTPEFLEVLQIFCTMVAVALETALHYQQEKSTPLLTSPQTSGKHIPLSDQLAAILGSVRLTLIGTEQPLIVSHTYLFLQVAEVLSQLNCRYCRLIYDSDGVTLEAIAVAAETTPELQQEEVRSRFGHFAFIATCLGGHLQTEMIASQKMLQISLRLPHALPPLGARLQIRCRQPLLQLAFTQLAYAANLQVCEHYTAEVPLLTDDVAQLHLAKRILWVQQDSKPAPPGAKASLNFSTTPAQLREAVESVTKGNTWGLASAPELPLLSEREREILSLLAEGLRDRDIANRLIISESTVKFHLTNVLTKLKARTRFQALHQAMKQGWI